MSRLWPGVHEGDEARLADCLTLEVLGFNPQGLARRMVPGGSSRFQGPSPQLPAASWALRLGDVLALPFAVELASAVGLLSLPQAPDLPDGLQRVHGASRLLNGQGIPPGLASHLCSEAGRWPATVWPDASLSFSAAPHSVGREIALAIYAPLVAAGVNDFVAQRLAESVSRLSVYYAALDRLWRDEACRDLRRGALSPALSAVREDSTAWPGLLDALAGGHHTRARLARAQQVLVAAESQGSQTRAWDAARDAVGGLLGDDLHPLAAACVAGWVEALDGAYIGLQMEIALRGAALGAIPISKDDGHRRALADAIEALQAEADCQEAWEVQRRGIGAFTGPLVGRIFPQAFIAQQLLEHPYGAETARRVLGEAPVSLRYYDDFHALPPDADSLGVMLDLAAQVGEGARSKVDGWLAVMHTSLGREGPITTWFYEGPEGSTVPEGAPRWGGAQCNAVGLSLLLGLLNWDAPVYRPLILANLQAICQSMDVPSAAIGGCFHYLPDYALGLFLRCAARLRELSWGDDSAEVLGVADAVAHAMIGLQRLDGSWGGLQKTALWVRGLAQWYGQAQVLCRARRFLVESQRGDGLWDAEPLWLTFGQPGATIRHQSRLLTTAIVAGALHTLQRV